jgi:hypothetical protein
MNLNRWFAEDVASHQPIGAQRPAKNASIILAVSTGRVTMNKCPSSIIWSLAFAMSRARMQPLIRGTRGSPCPIRTRVGCRSDWSQGRLVHPAMARSLNQ